MRHHPAVYVSREAHDRFIAVLVRRKIRDGCDESNREIPLTDDAFNAILKLRDQAKLLFGDSLPPDGYVMFWWPGTGRADIMRHAKGFRSAWKSMVREAGIGSLRFHDLRHTIS